MAPSSTRTQTPSAASARTPGFDVARALALLGMILVNYAAMAELSEAPPAVAWLIEQIEGKAAALFVTLAGVGVSLRVRSALRRGHSLAFEQRALVRRAVILFALGLVHRHFWPWDILHMYGVFLVLAAVLLRARSGVLLGLAAGVTALAVPIQMHVDYAQSEFWSLSAELGEIFFDGLFPVFPWLSFLLVGIVLGRVDLNDPKVRRPMLALCVPLIVGVEWLDAWADAATDAPLPHHPLAHWALAWPRPPTPAFALMGVAYATLIICVAIEVTQQRAQARWVVALMATGQLALTAYIAHGIAITIPTDYGYFVEGSQVWVLLYGLLFYVGCVWFAWRWRVRWRYGPVELIVRQLSAGSPAAPWGGVPLAELSELEMTKPS
ncbi:DUF418 domain-containing protein [Plesiocystis pacifica]|nr:heparan-alpha-glucosaminide N-acetyltransferase domain-containing protein [Plesiocystis pacifica]